MSHNDDELNELLKPLRNIGLNDLQLKKWQQAVQQESRKKTQIITTTRSKWALQLVAAMLVGFVIGAVVFKTQQNNSRPLITQNFGDDATYESVHAKLD